MTQYCIETSIDASTARSRFWIILPLFGSHALKIAVIIIWHTGLQTLYNMFKLLLRRDQVGTVMHWAIMNGSSIQRGFLFFVLLVEWTTNFLYLFKNLTPSPILDGRVILGKDCKKGFKSISKVVKISCVPLGTFSAPKKLPCETLWYKLELGQAIKVLPRSAIYMMNHLWTPTKFKPR